MHPAKIPRIICYGEVLWDYFPGGRTLGGAPINVAYHLMKLGCHALPVTAVGQDLIGEEIIQLMAQWGMDTRFVGRVQGKATGQVQVKMDNPDQPVYEIIQEVAWDHIPDTPDLIAAARETQAIVFGSLAQRSAGNLALLNKLLHHTRALKVFDVNLRFPFVDERWIIRQARQADLIKLNDVELSHLLQEPSHGSSMAAQAARLAEITHCQQICVTAGKLGAGWLRRGVWTWRDARPVEGETQDAVGAGDAFVAVLVAALLQHPEQTSEYILARACRLAEFVAGNRGATPEYKPESF